MKLTEVEVKAIKLWLTLEREEQERYCPFDRMIIRQILPEWKVDEYISDHYLTKCKTCYELFKNHKPSSGMNVTQLFTTAPRACPCHMFTKDKVVKKAMAVVSKQA